MSQNLASVGYAATPNDITWGRGASRSDMNIFNNLGDKSKFGRNFLSSRLWHGVPQLTDEQLSMFETAYTGHTFMFVVNVPRFMTDGIYKGSQMHLLMKNLKAVIERASTRFSGFSPITAETANQEDGNGRKVSHVINVTKEQSDISLGLHEFAGLPVKNAIETWLTGIYDPRSQHGNYHGNLGIENGWCLKNHSMSLLVVQVTPDWTAIQDAAYYYNMVPTEVPFDHFSWTKGEATIVDDYDITFVCNEERSPAIMLAAEKYMNNRVLSMVGTSVYNSRQFVIRNDFGKLAADEVNNNYLKTTPDSNSILSNTILDKTQYNYYVSNAATNNANETTAVKGTNFGEYGNVQSDGTLLGTELK